MKERYIGRHGPIAEDANATFSGVAFFTIRRDKRERWKETTLYAPLAGAGVEIHEATVRAKGARV
jgi:hypothetical protein